MRAFILLLLVLSLVVAGCAQDTAPATGDVADETTQPVEEQPPLIPEESPADTMKDHMEEMQERMEDMPMGPGMMSDVLSVEEAVTLCDSLCRKDAQAYCAEERVIVLDGVEVTGTCRAFSQTDHSTSFHRCLKFCKPFPKSTTECTVDGKRDENCDGKV